MKRPRVGSSWVFPGSQMPRQTQGCLPARQDWGSQRPPFPHLAENPQRNTTPRWQSLKDLPEPQQGAPCLEPSPVPGKCETAPAGGTEPALGTEINPAAQLVNYLCLPGGFPPLRRSEITHQERELQPQSPSAEEKLQLFMGA